MIGKPDREDQVAKWLRAERQKYQEILNRCPSNEFAAKRNAVDALLDRYKECSDYGLRLDEEGGDP